MDRYPTSLIEFQARFGTEEACAAYLIEQRWPDGFVCPVCGSVRAWRRKTLAHTFECADCGRQTSVRAGTILHDSKLPLTTWFLAAFLIATHSNSLPSRTRGACRPVSCNACSGWGRTGPPGCWPASCAGRWSIRSARRCPG